MTDHICTIHSRSVRTIDGNNNRRANYTLTPAVGQPDTRAVNLVARSSPALRALWRRADPTVKPGTLGKQIKFVGRHHHARVHVQQIYDQSHKTDAHFSAKGERRKR
jgi:hypothetical protein